MDLGPIEIPVTEVIIETLEISGGPKGNPGEPGAQGPQGPQGPVGPSGSSSWDDLEDVPDGVANLASGTLSMNYIEGLDDALGSKQDTLTGTGDVPGLDSALNTKQNNLTGTSDVPGLNAALDLKADTSSLASYQSLDQKGSANGYAGLGPDGKVPSGQLPAAQSLEWGAIEGTLSDQVDLTNALNSKQSTLTGTADVPGLDTALNNKADSSQLAGYQSTAEKGTANGYASLGSDGKVPSAQLPPGATTSWGDIEGTLTAQTDLNLALASKQDILSSTGDVPGLDTALSNKADTSALSSYQLTSQKGTANGYAGLDSGGKVPVEQLPDAVSAETEWGDIGGTLTDQVDLANALGDLQSKSEKGVAFGYAGLGADGKVPGNQLPPGTATAWGAISGVIADQTDLANALGSKQNTLTSTADVPGLDSALSGKLSASALTTHEEDTDNPHEVTAAQTGAIPTTEKGVANGVASLGSDGKVPAEQLPSAEGVSWGAISGTLTDQADLANALGAKQATLTGVSDVPGLVTALGDKADSSTLSNYQPTSERGVANGYATLGADGKVPGSQLPMGEAAAWGAISGSLEDQTDLQNALDGKASTSHTHSMADITSGSLPVNRGGTGATSASGARTNLGVPSTSIAITTQAPLTGGGNLSASRNLSIPKATGSVDGYLAATDFAAFDAKLDSSDLSSLEGRMLAAEGDLGDLQGDVLDLQSGKSDTSHTHTIASLSDVLISSPENGQGLLYDEANDRWVNGTAGGGSGGYEPPIPQSDVSGLTDALAGKAAVSHTHASTDITSGQLAELLALFSNLNPGETITVNEEGSLVAIVPATGSGGEGMVIQDNLDFGTGSDGPVTATTGTITADVNATTYTVPNGVTVTIGWNAAAGRPAVIKATTKIHVQAGGEITASGEAGTAGVGGAEGYGGTGGTSLSGGGGGGGGHFVTGGTGGSSPIHSGSAGTSSGGTGGAGGTNSFAAGGRGGYTTSNSDTYSPGVGGGRGIRLWGFPETVDDLLGSLSGGGGGGGGCIGTVNSSHAGGGGGGGGGGVGLYSSEIQIDGEVTARGGDGSSPLVSATISSSGGGGGGGTVQLVCRVLAITSWASVDVRGGESIAYSNTSASIGERGQDGALLVACEDQPLFAGIDRAQILYIPVAPTE